jgi:putative phosphonate catabolism associated alcohol dehydrogenase
MADTSRVMLFHESERPLELRRYALPHLAQSEVLIRVTCCTLCGSDLHTYEGRRLTPCPTVLGHEILGRVAALPSRSVVCDHEGTPLAVGDRVTWSVTASCEDCFFCNDGLPQKCQRLFKYGHERVSDGHPLSGGMADYCHLATGTAIFRVPSSLSDLVACPANCATATVAAAMRYAGPCAGRAVLIQGAGMLGLTAAAMAISDGAREVVVCDKLAERLQRACRFGATQTVIADDLAALRAKVDEATSGRGVDLAIDLSGAPEAMEAGVDLLRIGGRYVLVGAVCPGRPVSISAETIVRNLVSIQGVHNYTPQDLHRALHFLQETHERFPFEELVAESFALEDANAAFLCSSQSGALRVALRNSE